MNAPRNAICPSRLGTLLAVLSVATFWLLPLSPFIAMVAVSANNNSTNCIRRVSVVGAILCALFTIASASWIAFAYFFIITT